MTNLDEAGSLDPSVGVVVLRSRADIREPELSAPHRASPVLVVRLDQPGLILTPLDHAIDPHQDHVKLIGQRLGTVVPVSIPLLRLLEGIGAAQTVVPAELISSVLDAHSLSQRHRAELTEACEEMIRGDLLLDERHLPLTQVARTRLALAPLSPSPDQSVSSVELSQPLGDEAFVVAAIPVAVVPGPDGFEIRGHDGSVLDTLESQDLLVAATFVEASLVGDLASSVPSVTGSGVLEADEVRRRLGRLVSLGVIRVLDRKKHKFQAALGNPARRFRRADELLLSVVQEEEDRAAETGAARRRLVIPVDLDKNPLLSLGMLVAYATEHLPQEALDQVRFAPLWNTGADWASKPLLQLRDQPTIFLYSCYSWNHEENLAIARAAKEADPSTINIVGGTDVPKYEEDARKYLSDHPYLDFAVRGEGEATLTDLLGVLLRLDVRGDQELPDELKDVAGISYLVDGEMVRTEDRDRIDDLDTIPSPYLTGVYDHIDRSRQMTVILETNRGCPYGCTFCDWGSATLARIRKFDLDRVKADMEWAAANGRPVIGLADANFGMLDRDVEITQHAIDLKKKYGMPRAFNMNYAKNRVGNLTLIVSMMVEAGILTEGLISIQTNDAKVLDIIRRSNIKMEHYDALASEMRDKSLPLFCDVMVGLPGSSVDTLRADIQLGIDREVHIKAHPTQLLVNSPMNQPEYRAEHGIVDPPGSFLTQTNSYTQADWREMMKLRQMFYLAERRGMFRQIATYVRAETGLAETRCYDHLRECADDARRWPHLAYAVRIGAFSYLAPGSWAPLMDEVGQVLVDDLSVADDSALATVLRVQHGLYLTRGRVFPETMTLDHDYAAWLHDVLDAKQAYPAGEWVDHVGALRDFAPGELLLNDSKDRCDQLQGKSTVAFLGAEFDWELETAIARPIASIT